MKIYTRKGDDGLTSLAGGKRVEKHHVRLEAYGTVDELIAWISRLRDFTVNEDRKEILLNIQKFLMHCTAVLAGSEMCEPLPGEKNIAMLEDEIDKMDKSLPPLNKFIIPGGKIQVSDCNIARCVCRRAERAVLRMNEKEKCQQVIYAYLNRLSDFLFVLSRKISYELDNDEITWPV